MGLVVTTDPIHRAGAAVLEAAGHHLSVAGPDKPLTSLLADAHALIVRTKIEAPLLDHAPRLRAIVRHGVGVDFIPVAAATARGILVANVPGANSEAVAEYAFAAILDLARRLATADSTLRSKDWATARGPANNAIELRGRTIGIVGVGNIGRRVAEIANLGFGMTALGAQRNLQALPEFVRGVDIGELFASSDFVVLSCALTPETKGMIGAKLLARMKPNAFLINVARGELIDDAALVTCLQERRIAGAALDVFAEEPLPAAHPFRTLDNVLLTPHVASLTADSIERLSRISCEEIVRALRGERPLNLVNPDVWPKG